MNDSALAKGPSTGSASTELGGATGKTWAGMNLVGAGQESAQILFDVPAPPETSKSGDGRHPVKDASQRSTINGDALRGK